LIKRWII